ncbi:hypothetical protein O181_092235 [Austropuccinia psidii MF-1]|uniref:Uncharacterized protein n=1 Tax=Austropuccinia psidii MF-1 TaxID=1389203 RepID=A0A9Q3IZA9_9BASI|nr:hypothetical protein [Austropuccinia psidii MF-1]
MQKDMERRQNQVNSHLKLLEMQVLKECSDPSNHHHHQPQRDLKKPRQEHSQELKYSQKRVHIKTPTQQPERVTITTRKILTIKAKAYKLKCDESGVEDFIKKAERIESTEGANERNLDMQIECWNEDKDIRYEILGIPGYETEDWDQLKKEMISKWGKVEPERRHRKDLLTRLFNQTQQEGGFKSLSQCRKFIGEYDIISKYLLKYGYIKNKNDYHEDVFYYLSPDIRRSVDKEMIQERTMVQQRDGGYIVPEMDILRNYIEASSEVAVVDKLKSQLSKSDEIRSRKTNKI